MTYRLSASTVKKLGDILIHRYPTTSTTASVCSALTPTCSTAIGPRLLLTSAASPVRTVTAGQICNKFVEIKDEDDFIDTVMYSSEPVIVNFHAEWCQPCHKLTPLLESLVGASETLKLCTVDIGEYPELVREFEVQAVPSVVAVKRGRIVDKFVGLVDAERIEKFVKRLEEGANEKS